MMKIYWLSWNCFSRLVLTFTCPKMYEYFWWSKITDNLRVHVNFVGESAPISLQSCTIFKPLTEISKLHLATIIIIGSIANSMRNYHVDLFSGFPEWSSTHPYCRQLLRGSCRGAFAGFWCWCQCVEASGCWLEVGMNFCQRLNTRLFWLRWFNCNFEWSCELETDAWFSICFLFHFGSRVSNIQNKFTTSRRCKSRCIFVPIDVTWRSCWSEEEPIFTCAIRCVLPTLFYILVLVIIGK